MSDWAAKNLCEMQTAFTLVTSAYALHPFSSHLFRIGQCRAYRRWDALAAWHQVLTALSMALWPAMGYLQITWPFAMIIICVAVPAAATLMLLWRDPVSYAHYRHKLAWANRLIRLATTVLAAFRHPPTLAGAVKQQINKRVPYYSSSDVGSSLSSLVYLALPYGRTVLVPMLAMTQVGDGCVGAALWGMARKRSHTGHAAHS